MQNLLQSTFFEKTTLSHKIQVASRRKYTNIKAASWDSAIPEFSLAIA